MGLRSFPRAVTWYRAPGNSICRGRAMGTVPAAINSSTQDLPPDAAQVLGAQLQVWVWGVEGRG